MNVVLVESSDDECLPRTQRVLLGRAPRVAPCRRVLFSETARRKRLARMRALHCRRAANALLHSLPISRVTDTVAIVVSSDDEMPMQKRPRQADASAATPAHSGVDGHLRADAGRVATPTVLSERRDAAMVAKEYARHVAALSRDPLPDRYRLRRPRWAKFPPARGWWAATDPRSTVWDNPLLAHKARLHLVDKNVPGWSPTHHWGHVTGRPCPHRCQCCQAETIVAMPLGTLVECLARPCQVCLAFRDARPREERP